MRKVPENNSLKKEIRKLLELCKKNEKDNGEKRNYFNAPITEEEMINWEERNSAKIPVQKCLHSLKSTPLLHHH